jgi:cytochrome c oxidase subunit 2
MLQGWAAAILIGLGVLTATSFLTDRRLAEAASAASPLRIRMTAHQWWWQVEYLDPQPAQRFTTANELVLPEGRPVHIELTAADVIHSLWIPGLAGKTDLIPGRTTQLDMTPTRAAAYRGQCSEFCGLEHARMAMSVTVAAPAEFDGWRRHALADAEPPASPEAERGMAYFMNGACSACHAIGGTPAHGVIGPDLTHFASRSTIAAGTLASTRGSLEGWIANPQTLKPGAHMPATDISPTDLHAVTAYLEGLH